VKIYLIGSLRNPKVTSLAIELRGHGLNVFDDWMAAGPEADDYWMKYEKEKGHTYLEALDGNAAWHVFNYDKGHLSSSDVGILVLPAGKSGHLELGYIMGMGKRGFILMDKEPDRFDVMYRFAEQVFLDKDLLIERLKEIKNVAS
jgi:hypothetical protein